MRGNKRSGILAGGNWIIDQVKIIDVYPEEERLANIGDENTSNGGAPFNVLTALYKMGVDLPLEGVGMVGDDKKGDDILQECARMGINTKQFKISKDTNTSYTDVMTATQTGKRTFFHYRGANALLDESCFNFADTNAKIFHLGYLLLLDRLDKVTLDGATGAATVYKKAKEAGLLTSADIVSEQSNRYKEIIFSSLPFIDLLFLNEYEAEMLTGVSIAGEAESFQVEQACQAAETILDRGVGAWVVIHAPQGVVAMNKKKEHLTQPSIQVPTDQIKGSVGAGDALAAGVLYGIHEKWPIEKSLKLGVGVAAASLLDITASGGILPWEECMMLEKKYGYKNKTT